MATTKYLEVTPTRILELADNMRPEDMAEVLASDSASPFEAVSTSVARSLLSVAIVIDGEVAAIAGISDAQVDGANIAWMLSSTAVNRHKKTFAAATAELLQAFLRYRPNLMNMVDARYIAAVRWAKWLGFDVGEPVPFGPESRPFHPVFLRRRQWV